jgi:hypothetical protein
MMVAVELLVLQLSDFKLNDFNVAIDIDRFTDRFTHLFSLYEDLNEENDGRLIRPLKKVSLDKD